MTELTTTSDQIRARVRGALRTQLGDILDEVAETDELPAVLGELYDSLTALECVYRIEREFRIDVDFIAHDVRYAFSTIDRIGEFVRERLEDIDTLRSQT